MFNEGALSSQKKKTNGQVLENYLEISKKVN